jgi:hypothetical protein
LTERAIIHDAVGKDSGWKVRIHSENNERLEKNTGNIRPVEKSFYNMDSLTDETGVQTGEPPISVSSTCL